MSDRLFILKPPEFMKDLYPEELDKLSKMTDLLLPEGDHPDSFDTATEEVESMSQLDVKVTELTTDIHERVELYEKWMRYVNGLPDDSQLKLSFRSLDQHTVEEAFAQIKAAVDEGILPKPDSYKLEPIKSEDTTITATELVDIARMQYKYNPPFERISGELPEYVVAGLESPDDMYSPLVSHPYRSAIDVAKECLQKDSIDDNYHDFFINRFMKKQ